MAYPYNCPRPTPPENLAGVRGGCLPWVIVLSGQSVPAGGRGSKNYEIRYME